MQKNEILKIYGTDYKAMTKQLLEASDLVGTIPEGKRCIGIKPNLVSPSEASYGATTHPEIVAGIIEYLRDEGDYDIAILEGSWVGDRTAEAFEVCGYNALAKQYGVPLWDLQKDSCLTIDCGGMALEVCEKALQVDFLINVPVLKGHCQTKMTCALKNMKGLLPNKEKRHFHAMGLHKPIGHLSAGLHQDFIVIDHICGDLDFEDGGNPVVRNCIMTARDPVLADAYVCQLLHYKTEEVPYIGIAESLGVGSADVGQLKLSIIGDDQTAELPRTDKIVELKDAVEEVDSCSACYGYLMPALDMIREDGLWDDLMTVLREAKPSKICIGQGYRGKTGDIGIGQCAKDFAFHVPGCPPTENQVYEALKDLVLSKR